MPSRWVNSRSDRARPAASTPNHARPRAIALISVGSHRELSFCCANLALHKRATQSSLSQWSKADTRDGDAGNAVNGDLSKFFLITDYPQPRYFGTNQEH